MQLSYQKQVLVLIAISTLIRLFIGGQLEFGNDEVYYWLYAKYPDVSHIDHPPMVGFFIQLFTGNLFFDSELFIRLAAILPASFNMYLVYLIGTRLNNEKTGLIASLLYNLSIYGFIISGTFILPDAPLTFFWLLSVYFFLQALLHTPEKHTRKKMLLAFVFVGCAIYSKYQAVYLLFGAVGFVLLFNRKWLKELALYLGFVFPLLALGLIYYWNYKNDFISYTFHGDRVSLFSLNFNGQSLLREILGEFVYNNPYLYIVTILVLIRFFRGRLSVTKPIGYFFCLFSLPLLATTIYISLFRDTLPHWSGISFLTLLPLVAIWLSKKEKIIKQLAIGVGSLMLLMTVAVNVIQQGTFLPEATAERIEELGRKDVLMDMYGWKQASEKVSARIQQEDIRQLPIVIPKWFPGAHIDYYFARPNNRQVYGLGKLTAIHKYHWINANNPKSLKKALYITDSRNYANPNNLYKEQFPTIKVLDTVPVFRNEKPVKYVFIFELSQE